MTNSTIIIDGVDVSECKQIDKYRVSPTDDTKCCNYGICKGIDCYYKQLKCKEQENKRYKQALTDIEKYVNYSCGYYIPHGVAEIIQDIINRTKEK